MKNNILITLCTAGLLSLGSCDHAFDTINTNPNLPEKGTSYGLFNSANKELMDNTRGSFSSARVALPWVQYSAQMNYTEEDLYQYRVTSGDNLWRYLYSVANDYKSIIELNTDEQTKVNTALYGSNDNQIAAARIMLAYVFSNLADRFGDVPYYSYGNNDADFQALNVDVIKPKYASQEKIYTDILKELKEAAEMIDTSESSVFTSGDALFGTPDKMKKFANSLRLRIANRVKNVIPSATTHITEAIASGVMTSNDDSVGLTYENNRVNPAPNYTAFFIDNRTDYTISNIFVEILKGVRGNFGVDPRLQKMATPKGITIASVRTNNYTESSDINDYVGMPYGIRSNMTRSQRSIGISFLSHNVLKPDYTEIFMEYAEVCFLLSEINGWDQTHYENGVKASMEKWEVADSDIATYISTLPAASQENVLTQKYIALFMQPLEAWNEYRRTGYPSVLLKPGETHALNGPYTYEDANGNTVSVSTYTFTPLVTLTDLPGRMSYSARYKTLNADNYQAAIQNMGGSGDTMDIKLIWAQ
ncbi:MAG: SusD/RagB family nutrient-binding outer membrane lipoprotein [Capnocytophaga sp.]|nr:SusD/RagB family nutrient-binding outer membrane lipoprotein [Capnocytophaga sp.]